MTDYAPSTRPAALTTQERYYCHEIIDVSVRRRRGYLEAFCDMAVTSHPREKWHASLLGNWATLAHRNAEMIQIWECDTKSTLANDLPPMWEFLHAADKPETDWSHWSKDPEVRETQGMDRFLMATDYTPPMSELIADGVHGEVYLHMNMATRPGEIDDHLARLGAVWLPVARRLGLKLVGAYRSLLVNDDLGLSVWAFPTWRDWARYEDQRLTDPEARAWFAECAANGVVMDGRLMVASACTPLRTGKPI